MIESLITTITACLEHWPPTADQRALAMTIFSAFGAEVRRGIEMNESWWAPAAFAQWTTAIAAIGWRCAVEDEVVALTLEVLENVDMDAIGNHAARTLATLLSRAAQLHPLSWPLIEAHWTRSEGVRAAMIEALLAGPFPAARQHAVRLSQDPLCPPAAANQVMKRVTHA